MALSHVETALVLRAAAPADLDAIMAIERSPGYEARVGRSTRGEHEAMLAGPRHAYFVGEREGVEAFAILRDLDDPARQRLSQAHRGAAGARRGPRRCLPLLLDWTFAHTPAHRFHLDCFDDNAPAQAMYERLGFTRDGVLREAYLGPGRPAPRSPADGADAAGMGRSVAPLQHDERAIDAPVRLEPRNARRLALSAEPMRRGERDHRLRRMGEAAGRRQLVGRLGVVSSVQRQAPPGASARAAAATSVRDRRDRSRESAAKMRSKAPRRPAR